MLADALKFFQDFFNYWFISIVIERYARVYVTGEAGGSVQEGGYAGQLHHEESSRPQRMGATILRLRGAQSG